MARLDRPADRPLHGIIWMLASGLCFVGVTGIVRYLGTDLPAAQAAFIRFGWGVVFLTPALWALWRGGMPVGAGWLFAGRVVVLAVGLLGAVIVLQPGLREVTDGCVMTFIPAVAGRGR